MVFLALSSHELKNREDRNHKLSSNDNLENNAETKKKFHCHICGGLCSEVLCWKCKKVTCMLHRTLVQAGVICSECRKASTSKNNNGQEL